MNTLANLFAALLGAFAATAVGALAEEVKHPRTVSVDTCTQEMALLNSGMSDLMRMVETIPHPSARDALDADFARAKNVEALQAIDRRLTSIEQDLAEISLHARMRQ